MIMRLRYVGVKLKHVERGTVFYVKFEQEQDLSICVTTRSGDQEHYRDLYHFLMEWKILTIEKGHEHERYDKSNRRNAARIGGDRNSFSSGIVCYSGSADLDPSFSDDLNRGSAIC